MSNQEVIVTEVEETGFKVFCGNLSFKTTEVELKDAFADAGEVLSANIITRNSRSLGYGFVTFATDVEAKSAAAALNKHELHNRVWNVEQAKPKLVTQRPAGNRNRGNNNSAQSDSEAVDGELAAAQPATHGARRPKNNRRRKSGGAGTAQPARIDAAEIGDDQPATAAAAADGATSQKPRRIRKKRAPRNNGDAAEIPVSVEGAAPGAESDGAAAKPSRQRQPRGQKRVDDPEAPLSKTTLFVANLPFQVDSEGLAGIFKDFTVTSAKVITLRNGRSKGFGFVSVKDQVEQQRVLTEMGNAQVDGRELVIKVALATADVVREPSAE